MKINFPINNVLVDKVIELYNIKITSKTATEYRGLCPVHSETNPSWGINRNTGLWHCFSCGKNGSLISLIMKLKKCDYDSAIQYLFNGQGADTLTQIDIKIKHKKLTKDLSKSSTHLDSESDPTIDKVSMPVGAIKLCAIEDCPSYLLSRIKFETVKLFKLGKVESGYFANRIIIPIYENNELVGFTTRDYSGINKIKQLHPVKWNIGKYMLNLDNLDFSKPVIVVEGPFDCMYLVEQGYTNCVCIFGINFNMDRINKLISRGVRRVILCFDNDLKTGAGQKATEETIENIKSFFELKHVELPPGKDPDELTKEQLDYVFTNAKRVQI